MKFKLFSHVLTKLSRLNNVYKKSEYHKVTNRSTSRLVASPRIFRVPMKGKLHVYLFSVTILGKS